MRLTLGHVAIRESPTGDGRTIEGVALPWDASTTGTPEYGSARESFERGAFAGAIERLAGRSIAYLDRHDGTVIGAVQVSEGDPGLMFGGRLLSSQAATDYAERVQAGVDGVSLEFLPGKVRRGRETVTHTAVDQLLAIAGTHAPAYQGAQAAVREVHTVTDIREVEPPAPEPPTEPQPDPRAIIRAELETFRRELAERPATTEVDPYARLRAYRNLGDIVWAIAREDAESTELRDVFVRALADQVTTNNAGVMTPGVLGEVRRIVGQSRPGIESFGREPLTGEGMNVEWPYFAGNLGTLVGEQITQKTEITSARVDLLKGSTPIKTYAGGSDISYQLIRRSSPSYLDAYSRILLAAYAAVTNTVFVNTIEGDTGTGKIVLDLTAGGTTDAAIRQALFQASVMVQDATGSPATFVLASASAFIRIGGALNPAGTQNGQMGDASAATLAPELSGLPIRYDPNVNAGNAVVSNGRTAAWHEDGPFQATEEDVARLGRNVAYWGMGATAIYIPAGIVEIGAVVGP